MKTYRGIVAALALWSGCASESGVDRAGHAVSSMAAMRKLCDDGTNQVDRTVASLNAFSTVKSGDPRPTFDAYVAQVNRSNALAADAKATADDIRSRGRAFFSEWEKDADAIKDPELREKAKARAGERSRAYAKIEELMGTVRGKWNALAADLADLKKFLENDLNPKGIDLAAPRFTQVNLDAVDLKNAIGSVSAQLDQVAADLTPGK